jgi:hypothetical protein
MSFEKMLIAIRTGRLGKRPGRRRLGADTSTDRAEAAAL